jgi:glycosyltransferase involved in cell wall biosynthesis
VDVEGQLRTAQHPTTGLYRVGFVIEQDLGHRTHSENLREAVPQDRQIDAVWGPIPFEADGFAARLPVYSTNWTVRAGLRTRRAVAAMTRGTPLDALFIHTQVPAVLALDWVRHIPTVISLDATPIQFDQLGSAYGHRTGPAWLERLKWRMNRAVLHAARHLVAWSRWAEHGVVDQYGVPSERVTVIPPGVHTGDWARPEPREAHPHPMRILFVGAEAERKGGLLLLEAFRALRDALPLQLDLVTRSPLESEPGVLVHRGLRANTGDLRALYHRADIFCLPTDGDCLPLALAEAAASGLPAVATGIAGIPEIVHDGETGFLIRPGDLKGLIEALRRLATDATLRLAMGRRAAALAANEHDAGRNAKRLLEVIKLTVEAGRRDRS